MNNGKPLLSPWCPECGPQLKCDEDGLCASCGASMILNEVYEKIVGIVEQNAKDGNTACTKHGKPETFLVRRSLGCARCVSEVEKERDRWHKEWEAAQEREAGKAGELHAVEQKVAELEKRAKYWEREARDASKLVMEQRAKVTELESREELFKRDLALYRKKLTDVESDAKRRLDLLETAWVIIANSEEGDWAKASKDWQDAAARFRDAYHKELPTPKNRTETP